MPLYQSRQVVSRSPVPSIDAANIVTPIHAEYVVRAGGVLVNDVIEMFGIEPNMRVVDAVVHNTAAGAGATFDMGYLSGNYGSTLQSRTCGNEFIAAGDMNATTVKRLVKSVTTEPPAAAGNLTDPAVGWGLKVTGATWAANTVIRATLYVVAL